MQFKRYQKLFLSHMHVIKHIYCIVTIVTKYITLVDPANVVLVIKVIAVECYS